MGDTKYSKLAVIGGLTVALLLALAGVLLIQPGTEATQRLGLFFGVLGTVVAALIGMLRADQGAKQTNGSLDERIEAAVFRAQLARRRALEVSDTRPDGAELDRHQAEA